MREIKFRGKSEFTGEWFYGDLFTPHYEGQPYHIQAKENFTAQAVHTESVGQFTGLTDKNGKEIYEGDIVLSNVGYGEFKGQVKTAEVFRGGWYPFCQGGDSAKSEVIGNIYENPELLK